jgi:hypothetical protein
VDVAEGKAESGGLASVPAPPDASPPAAAAEALAKGRVRAPLWHVGGVWAGVRTEVPPGGAAVPGRVHLERWDAGTGNAREPLLLSEGGFEPLVASPDAKYLLSSRPLEASPTGWSSYRWVIHSLGTGERLGEATAVARAMPFAVVDRILVFATRPYSRPVNGEMETRGHLLHGVDLAGGKEAWAFPIVPPDAVAGPTPPR